MISLYARSLLLKVSVACGICAVFQVDAIPLAQFVNIQKIGSGDNGYLDYNDIKDKTTSELFNSGFIPKYPMTYAIEADFGLPYIQLAEPVRVCVDSFNKRQSISYYNGLDRVVYDLMHNKSYEEYVRMDRKKCEESVLNSGPTSFRHHEKVLHKKRSVHMKNRIGGDKADVDVDIGSSLYEHHATHQPKVDPWKVKFMPELEYFTYQGLRKCNDHKDTPSEYLCHHWVRKALNFTRESTYAWECLDDELFTPHIYTMTGYDVALGSHYDLYNIRYISFSQELREVDFYVPESCENTSKDKDEIHNTMLEELHHLFEGVDHGLVKFTHHIGDHDNLHYYEDAIEFATRLELFYRNMHLVNTLNRHSHADSSATFRLNHFASMHEYEQKDAGRGGCNIPEGEDDNLFSSYTNRTKHVHSGRNAPEQKDWRTNGAIAAVKDQATCGSCWAFATVETVEAAHFIATGEQIILSPQNLVDCSWDYSNNGCDGGNTDPSFQYIMDHGLLKESDYRYIGQNGYCQFEPTKSAVKIIGIVDIPSGDEEMLKDVIAHVGPVAISYDASNPSMTYYSSGIYYEPKCKNDAKSLDHAVSLIGYGKTKEGEQYWVVKNSWSTYFGEMGYFRIARDKNNHCGIATDASYPVMGRV